VEADEGVEEDNHRGTEAQRRTQREERREKREERREKREEGGGRISPRRGAAFIKQKGPRHSRHGP
jgi:hypothetical protein